MNTREDLPAFVKHNLSSIILVGVIVVLGLLGFTWLTVADALEPMPSYSPSPYPYPTSSTTPRPSPTPAPYTTQLHLSPDAHFIAHAKAVQLSGLTYQISLYISPRWSDEASVVSPDTSSSYAYPLWQTTTTVDSTRIIGNLYTDTNTFPSSQYSPSLAWSPDSSMIALALPDTIALFTFDHNNDNTAREDGQPYVYLNTKLPPQLLPIAYASHGTATSPPHSTLFFSADGACLYASFDSSSTDILYRYSIADESISALTPDADSYTTISPVPGTSGFAYWMRDSKTSAMSIMLETGANQREYNVPITGLDYPGSILISPDRKHVCLEWGSSGFHGYTLYRLSDMEEVASGGQYSYCRRWLSDTELVVLERPYFSQGLSSWIVLDIISGEKRLIDSKSAV